MTTTTPKKPPDHLCKRAKKLWREVVSTFVLEPHHIELLRAACEQLGRAEAARKVIERNGLVVEDRFKQAKPNPAVEIERQAHLAFLRITRELGLDLIPESRGPRRPGILGAHSSVGG